VVKNDIATDPIKLFFHWYDQVQTGGGGPHSKKKFLALSTRIIRSLLQSIFPWSNLFRPDIATLATTTANDKPAARSVLFKGFIQGGFSFYTDYASNKGLELQANPSAVLVFYWHFPPRQVRIDGRVVKLSRREAEADWKARRRENQTASAAFPQSSIIQGREELKQKVNQIKRQYRGRPIPCPDSWGGYCLIPEKMEFWEGRLDWIHRRERYVLNSGTWQRQFLAP